jgi:putative ABC transport system permease protein
MSLISDVGSRLRSVLFGSKEDEELDTEIRFHIEQATLKGVASGLDENEAKRRAHIQFGGVERMRARAREARGIGWLDGWLTDTRRSARALLRQPSFVAVVAFSLALGIGASTAIFSVFNAALLRDLPYPDPGQIYMMRTVTPDGSPTGTVTPREVRPFSESATHPTVHSVAIAWSQEVQIVGDDGTTHPTRDYGVTEQFFEVFGSDMRLGRGFVPGEQPGPIVIAYHIWRDLFDSDPNIVGRSVSVGGFPREVVGVTPQDFAFPEDPGFWHLMRLGPQYDRSRVYRSYVRLHAGRTEEQFQADLDRLSADLGPDPVTGRPVQFVAQPFLHYVVGDLRATVTILLGATALLMLIACLNVANLQVSRATVQAREVALRDALGAGRWRIVRDLLTESVLLAGVGGALGVVVALVGVRLLMGLAPADLPRLDAVPFDGTVLLFALGATAITGVLIGLAPAWSLRSSQPAALVNESGRGTQGSRSGSRALSGLVVAEVALSVVLVIGAALLIRTYANLTATDPGFQAEGALTFFLNVPGRVDIRFEGMDGDRPTFSGTMYQPMATFFRDLEERIGGLPGVASVANANSVPLGVAQYDGSLIFELSDRPGGQDSEAVSEARTRAVGPSFFTTMQTALLGGRGFEPGDREGTPGVAVVNESFARRYLPDREPLGQRLHFPANRYVPGDVGFQLGHLTVNDVEIVGVVADVKYWGLAEPAEPTIYVSSEQWINRRRHFVVRAHLGDPSALIPAIKEVIGATDSSLTAQYELYPSIVRSSIARERMGMTLLVTFGVVALLLAAVGIYGLLSYSVAQRRGEIAVRSAIGASARQVMRLVVGRGIVHTLLGVSLGIGSAVALRRVIESQLYGVSALDLRVFTLVPLTLLLVAVTACLVPAWRAARIQPADLLRTD